METVYLALGSNVGDSQEHIKKAVQLLGESLQHIKRAPIYRSKAVGYTDQPNFLNTAIEGQTQLSPQKLLKFIKDVEKRVGRVARFRWGPREIDIDIIFYGDQIVEQDGLTIPHARFAERDFVLHPLCDLAPDMIDPISKNSIKQLLDALPPDQQAIKQ